jgi:hypothetical protein
MLAAALTLCIAMTYLVLQGEWSSSAIVPVLRSLGLAWLLLLTPTALRKHNENRSIAGRWLGGDAGVQLLVGAVLALLDVILVWFVPAATIIVGTGAAMAGALSFAIALKRGLGIWFRSRLDGRNLFGGVALFVATTLYTVGFAWGFGYQNPRFFDKIAQGTANRDTLFHSAIAHILVTHGLPSTGLDGAPMVHYHFGSHWLLCHLSCLAGTTPLEFYQFGFQIVAIPWVFLQILGLATDLIAAWGDGEARLSSNPWFWLTTAAVWTGVNVPFVRNFAWVNANMSVSESYSIATGLFMACASVVVHWVGPDAIARRDSANPNIAEWPRSTLARLAVFVPPAVLVLGLVKISYAAVALSLIGFLWLRLGFWRQPLAWVPVVGALISALIAAKMTTRPHLGSSIVAFDFMRHWVLRSKHPSAWVLQSALFVALHYGTTWALVAFRWRQLGGFRGCFRMSQGLDVQIAMVTALCASLPGMVLAIDGGGAYYFSDIQRWLSLALLLSWLAKPTTTPPPYLGASIRTPHWGYHAIRAMLALHIGYNACVGGLRLYDAIDTQSPIESAQRDVVERLRAIATLPIAERRKSAIFVPRDYAAYWKMLPPMLVPFVAPAITGLVHIDGLPDGDNRHAHYGYDAYLPRQTNAPSTVANALQRAHDMGYQFLYVFDANGTRRLDTAMPYKEHD